MNNYKDRLEEVDQIPAKMREDMKVRMSKAF